jgi:hypothetical protein
LRGAGGDVADAEIAQGLAEVGRGLLALEFFLKAPMGVVADEDIEPVAIQPQGQAVAGGQATEQEQIAVEILGGPELQGEQGTGGVIQGAEQQARGPRPEPVVFAAIEEDERAELGGRGPAAAMPPGAAAPLGRDAVGQSEATDGAAAELEALHLAQLLREMAIVEPGIDGLEQLGHPIPDLDLQGARGRAAPEAVEQAGHALGLVAALEAAELTHGDVQGFRPLAVRDLAREPRLDQTGPRHLLLAHLESLPCVHGGTFLLTS